MKKTSILVVDDNPTTLHLLARILEEEGYEITRATNGLEAMNELRSRKDNFDVIVLDRMMPVMDGMEVTAKILADGELKHIPIVMQTAADQPEQISEGIKAGVFYYLTKPIERKTLLSVVSSAVKEVEQRRVLRAEMLRHRMSFGLIQVLKGSCRTLDEAESLASFLANCFPDPDRALTGISEILINGVEHGNLDISYDENSLTVGDQKIEIVDERDPAKLPWSEKGIDIVLECTGKFTKGPDAAKHIEAGAKKVLISAPAKEIDLTVVMGVNDRAVNIA